jgi:hypothetical protein
VICEAALRAVSMTCRAHADSTVGDELRSLQCFDNEDGTVDVVCCHADKKANLRFAFRASRRCQSDKGVRHEHARIYCRVFCLSDGRTLLDDGGLCCE